jgi:hypothetical protein
MLPVKVMKTFHKCQALQECALANLACCSIGKAKALESGGFELLLLAALNNHLDSAIVCENACWAMRCTASRGAAKENTELPITLGGGAAVAKVSQTQVDG